uniref:Uncharacterized protein n=1 Tax=Anser brachyrhynchus TaxID=132585 RepID=A0A8B9C690_9AVES
MLPTHPNFAHFLLTDGDLLAIDLNVGQVDVGDRFHPASDVVLGLHLEGHQLGVVPTGFSHGVGAGALEVEIAPVEGVVVGVTPTPAGGHQGWDTLGLAILKFARLLGPEKKCPWGMFCLLQKSSVLQLPMVTPAAWQVAA